MDEQKLCEDELMQELVSAVSTLLIKVNGKVDVIYVSRVKGTDRISIEFVVGPSDEKLH
jgi:hypothetical protein